MGTAAEQVTSDEQLMEMLRSRNGRAIELLYDQYSSMLYGIIYRIVSDAKRAEEILFKTFTHTWNHYNHFDNNQQSVSIWLMSIARQSALNSLTSQKRVNAENRLLSLLKDVSVKEKKTVLELVFLQGLSVIKIAEQLGYSESDVKTFLHQAAVELQNEFSTK
jgi:RNA polymerase sigma-70 factor, ECF subfamily